jgi:tRNA threonylcarbamoyl adenosine modification protein (Sua5/YciO/YrdC/YwlC family)
MAQFFEMHPENPQKRLVREAVGILRSGGVIVYPTDSLYALGCQVGDKPAMERMRWLRDIDERHHLTLMCRDIAAIGEFARLDNRNFRLIRANTPGAYTFILPASRDLPRRVAQARSKTIGVRIPSNPIALALLEELGEPMLSTSLMLPGEEQPLDDAARIRERLEHSVDLVIDGGSCGLDPSTVIDLTGDAPVVVRAGRGSVAAFLH